MSDGLPSVAWTSIGSGVPVVAAQTGSKRIVCGAKAIEALTSSPSRQVRDPCGCPELLPEPKLLDPHWDADNDPVPTRQRIPGAGRGKEQNAVEG